MAFTDQLCAYSGNPRCTCRGIPDRSFPRLACRETEPRLPHSQKVAKQLPPVAGLPQEIRDRAIAGRKPTRYHEILLVKHPSLPVRMRAGSPGTRRGFFQVRTSSQSHLGGNDRFVGHAAELALQHLYLPLEDSIGRL